MCRDQGLLGVPFKGWNRLIRPLALQDLVNKVPVVVGFHYYTFFNWAINGKVVQFFFWKSHKTSDFHIWGKKSMGGYCFRFYPSTLNIILRSQSKGQASLFIEKVITVLVMPFRWRFMWSSQSFSSYFVPFDVKSYFHKRPKVLSYKYI